MRRYQADYYPDDFMIVSVAPFGSFMTEYRDWAIKHAGFDKLLPLRGEGQRVGILDTGVDPHHQDLEGQVTATNFIVGNKQQHPWADQVGHGCFVTGEVVAREDGVGIIGAAPMSTALCARVMYGDRRDGGRTGMDDDIANAIRACVDGGCGVLSMSFGGPRASRAMSDALEYAVSRGCIPVAAAGNERLEGKPVAMYPASFPNVVSVAAANKDDLPAWFSTIGAGGNEYTQPEIAVASLEYYWGCLPGRATYGQMIGTSMAAPLVAAAALLWREGRCKLDEEGKQDAPTGAEWLSEFRAWLRTVSQDTNRNGWDPELGHGVLKIEPAAESPSAS